MSPPSGSGQRAGLNGSGVDGAAGPDSSTRRLSDKILAAFNHAYAVGEVEVADLLLTALRAGAVRDAALPEQRRGCHPLKRAELWIAFVDARNEYRGLCEAANGETAGTDEALGIMKDAYRRWSKV